MTQKTATQQKHPAATSIPKTMKAAAIDKFGAKIKLHELPVPQAGPDEVLIRLESAGVGVWDPFEIEGGFAKMMGTKPKFPYIPGADGAGTVVNVGERVRAFKPGDRVYAMALANPVGSPGTELEFAL